MKQTRRSSRCTTGARQRDVLRVAAMNRVRSGVDGDGASCAAAPPPQPSTPSRARRAGGPPAPVAKDVIEAAMASGHVRLAASANCAGAGTEPSDATIGRYLAGFLAELSAADKKNWIETKVEPGTSESGEPVSVCTLTLRHEDGDDRWGWGVQFKVRSSDGLVLPDSFACVGAATGPERDADREFSSPDGDRGNNT